MTVAKKSVKERDKIIALQQDMLAHYERDLFPKYRERAEKALCVRDAERAHNAVLRQALEEIMRYLKRAGEPDVGLVLLYGICEQALSATPYDSAAKVQKLVELLQDAVSETENGENLSAGFISAAKTALAEWRGEK